jgi:hypothetical protein
VGFKETSKLQLEFNVRGPFSKKVFILLIGISLLKDDIIVIVVSLIHVGHMSFGNFLLNSSIVKMKEKDVLTDSFLILFLIFIRIVST